MPYQLSEELLIEIKRIYNLFSDQDLAEKIGLNKKTIERWRKEYFDENKPAEVQESTLAKIARALDIEIKTLKHSGVQEIINKIKNTSNNKLISAKIPNAWQGWVIYLPLYSSRCFYRVKAILKADEHDKIIEMTTLEEYGENQEKTNDYKQHTYKIVGSMNTLLEFVGLFPESYGTLHLTIDTNHRNMLGFGSFTDPKTKNPTLLLVKLRSEAAIESGQISAIDLKDLPLDNIGVIASKIRYFADLE